jgi:hypothetical protein
MQNQLFEAALGIARPWFVQSVDFDPIQKVLTIKVDFVAGPKFPAPGAAGQHPVHDTQTKHGDDEASSSTNASWHEIRGNPGTPYLIGADLPVTCERPTWRARPNASHGDSDDTPPARRLALLDQDETAFA